MRLSLQKRSIMSVGCSSMVISVECISEAKKTPSTLVAVVRESLREEVIYKLG